MKKLISVLMLGFIILFNTSFTGKRPGCLKADILLISDWSGSISGYEHFICSALEAFVYGFDLSEYDIKIGLITFADSAYLEVPLTSNQRTLKSKLSLMSKEGAGGGTNMYSALEVMIKEFKVPSKGHGRKQAEKIAIIISDGATFYEDKVERLASLARTEYEIKIFTININDDESTNAALLKKIASEDCYFYTNYEHLKELLLQFTFCG